MAGRNQRSRLALGLAVIGLSVGLAIGDLAGPAATIRAARADVMPVAVVAVASGPTHAGVAASASPATGHAPAKLRTAKLRVERSATTYRYGSTPVRLTIRSSKRGVASAGTVRVRLAGTWRSVRLDRGVARYTLPRYLAPGRHAIVVRYRPNASHRWANARTTVRVLPGTSGLRLTRTQPSYRLDRKRAKVAIRASAAGRAGSGRVALTVAGRTYRVTLRSGKASFTMPAGLRPGTYRVTGAYRKTSRYRLATAATTIRVLPKPPAATVPGASAKPTAVPTRVATPKPSPSATRGASPTGSASPRPAASPARTPTPVVTPTPKPTATPTVTPTPAPTKLKLDKSVMAGAWNFRDLAGTGTPYPLEGGGHLAKGVVYRSNALSLTAGDVATLTGLGISTIYDLRRPTEIANVPDTAIPGVAWLNIDIYSTGSSSGGMPGTYRAFADNAIYRDGFGRLLRDIADNPNPVVFHCAAGKDRTGWSAALLQSIAGVPRESIMADFLASNEYLNGTLRPGQTGYAVQVDAAWLTGAFDQVAASYGSMHSYLTDGLGLTDSQLAKLKAKLTGS